MMGKTELLEALAPMNRGIGSSAAQRSDLLRRIVCLEEQNPTPSPAKAASLLDGDWELRYTTSTELLNIDNVPILRLGKIYQSIRVDAGRVYNVAEVEGIPYCEGLISVSAQFELWDESSQASDAPVTGGDRRLSVRFERGIFGLQRWVGYQAPAQFIPQIQSGQRFPAVDFTIQGRQGWIDITYLDDTMRINRGNEGSIFVLTRA